METNRKVDVYNKEDLYTKKIAPLIRDIQVLCIKEEMPMFISVAVANNKKGTKYVNNTVMGVTGIRLKDNRIAKLLLYINDFKNELPPDVEKAAAVIEGYVESIKNTAGNNTAAVNLHDDMISDFVSIAGGGDDIRIK